MRIPDLGLGPTRGAVLLYNDQCSVCRKVSGWVKASDEPKNGGNQRIDERPIGHDPEALKLVHPSIDIWDAYEKVHLVLPNGEVKKGGEAVGEVLRRLPQTDWIGPFLDLKVLGLRPFQKLVDGGYYVLDRLRPALGCESCGTPVPWWGKPIDWARKGWQSLKGG
jgi:predicted DCC family thiol-disulfide oxidoreductase YuxK